MGHTRNQKRMYRIKKLEEKIVDLENISKKAISELSTANDKLKEIDNQAKTQISIIKSQPSPNKEADDYFIARLETISKIIEGDEEE